MPWQSPRHTTESSVVIGKAHDMARKGRRHPHGGTHGCNARHKPHGKTHGNLHDSHFYPAPSSHPNQKQPGPESTLWRCGIELGWDQEAGWASRGSCGGLTICLHFLGRGPVRVGSGPGGIRGRMSLRRLVWTALLWLDMADRDLLWGIAIARLTVLL